MSIGRLSEDSKLRPIKWVAWLCLPALLVGAWLWGRGSEQRGATEELGATVVVGARQVDQQQSVNLEFSVGPPRLLRLSNAGGVVTEVGMRESHVAGNCQPVVQISGTWRYLFGAQSPLFRRLQIGDHGGDVHSLNAWLRSCPLIATPLRSAVPSGNRFTSGTRAALNGLPRRGESRAFDHGVDPGTFLFLSPGSRLVSQIQTQQGDTVSADAVLANFVPNPVALTLTSGAESADAPLALQSGEPFAIKIPGEPQLAIKKLPLTLAQITLLHERAVRAVSQGSLTEAPSPDPSLAVFTGATVELVDAVRVGTVPGSALVIDSSGHQCLVEVDDHGARRPISVPDPQTLSGEFGVVTVASSLVGLKVLRAPNATDQTCE